MNLRNICAFQAFLLTTTMFVSPVLAGFEPMLKDEAAYTVQDVEDSTLTNGFSIYSTEKKTETYTYQDKDGNEKTISVDVIELGDAQHYQYEQKPGLTSGAQETETPDGKDITAIFASQNSNNNEGQYTNTQTVHELKAEFIDNQNNVNVGDYPGSALRNKGNGNIDKVVGDFINNKVTENGWNSGRGSISNQANIGTIQGNFINNSVVSNRNMPILGAAIANGTPTAHIRTIENSVFVGNNLSSQKWVGGGAISNNNSAKIDLIRNSFFSENNAETIKNPSDPNAGRGGAIYNAMNDSKIGEISGSTFIKNKSNGGGAIYNEQNASIQKIKDNVFIENKATLGNGGAIYNGATMGDIENATFVKNTAATSGGAIYTHDTINNINGNFIENTANQRGSAIDNYEKNAKINGTISGNFIRNGGNARSVIDNSDGAYINKISANFIDNEKAAIYNSGGTINEISDSYFTGDIGVININNSKLGTINNTVFAEHNVSAQDSPSVIYNSAGSFIDTIDAVFYKNTGIIGIGIYNTGSIGSICGIFEENISRNGTAGAIYNSGGIDSISGNFYKNVAIAGGAIHNASSIASISGIFEENVSQQGPGALYNTGNIGLISASFIKNSAENYHGGAIYSTTDLTVAATDKDIEFSGNTDSTGSNAIYLDGNEGMHLELSADSGKKLVVNDGIDSKNAFDLSVGKTYMGGEVVLNNEVKNVAHIDVTGSTLSLGENASLGNNSDTLPTVKLTGAELNLANNKIGETHIGSLNSIRSDLRVDVDLENKQADMLYVHGNVEGQTNVILNLGEDASLTEALQLAFVQSENDMTGNADSFSIYRMMRSPFDVDVAFVQTGENKNQWLLDMEGQAPEPEPDPEPEPEPTPDPEPEPTPDPEPEQKPTPKPLHRLTPEALTYLSLPSVVIEQSRYVSRNVLDKADQNAFLAESDKPKTWVDVQGRSANYDKKLDIDADIWGIDAGATLGGDASNSYGVFASYRKGNYDIGHKFGDYYSKTSSDVDVSSYLLGGYYTKKYNNLRLAADVFAGRQSLDVKTHDGVTTKTSANELGFGARAYGFAYQNNAFGVKPFAGLSYHYYDIKSLKDDFAKKAAYDDLSHLELELGTQFTYGFESGLRAYLTPSLIQNITSGDDVKITNLDKVNSAYEDDLLVKTEFGIGYDFSESFNAGAFINYTYGANYDAISAGLDVKYLF
ncbi:MAG: autotransporter outer membrane beta-barrel domain-containing protein [Alphaproteobacteria bacterium]|nr:autotransporter outer membrane beta-barrel domain-containing protein [Alphaproteobacteria bacterium]